MLFESFHFRNRLKCIKQNGVGVYGITPFIKCMHSIRQKNKIDTFVIFKLYQCVSVCDLTIFVLKIQQLPLEAKERVKASTPSEYEIKFSICIIYTIV